MNDTSVCATWLQNKLLAAMAEVDRLRAVIEAKETIAIEWRDKCYAARDALTEIKAVLDNFGRPRP